eukprot:TRINITY_DN6013_c0_g1_i6.p1 TRINITY_DN6013_c0_g1~~TRINITY_DN6013_c0_g1_i6.p1  ORF type:complete len:317 (+),score=80.15 TRINITY_DN6013_c0_g1_i6:116-1066(+)
MELNLDDSFLYEGFSEFSNDNKENLVMNDRKSGRWTKSEHMKFLEGLKTYGKNWKKVEDFVGSRSGAQIRSHAQKFFNRLEKEYHIAGCKKDGKSNVSLKIKKENSTESAITVSTHPTRFPSTSASDDETKATPAQGELNKEDVLSLKFLSRLNEMDDNHGKVKLLDEILKTYNGLLDDYKEKILHLIKLTENKGDMVKIGDEFCQILSLIKMIDQHKDSLKQKRQEKIRKKQEEILSGYKTSSKDSFYVHLMKSLSTEVEDPFKCELRLSNLVEWKFRNPKTEFFTLVSSTPHTVQHRTSSCAQEPPASKKVKEF